eukprot:1326226-Alexandrium_andersonii.AAC.1
MQRRSSALGPQAKFGGMISATSVRSHQARSSGLSLWPFCGAPRAVPETGSERGCSVGSGR